MPRSRACWNSSSVGLTPRAPGSPYSAPTSSSSASHVPTWSSSARREPSRAGRLGLEHHRPHVQRLDRGARGGADGGHLAARQGADEDALHGPEGTPRLGAPNATTFTPSGLLGELVELFNERYGAELGEVDALKVMTDVRDSVRDENPDLADQAEANSRDDFVRERDSLLIGAALAVGGDRERQATLLKALLDDEDFRVRAGELVFGAIYDGYRTPPEARRNSLTRVRIRLGQPGPSPRSADPSKSLDGRGSATSLAETRRCAIASRGDVRAPRARDASACPYAVHAPARSPHARSAYTRGSAERGTHAKIGTSIRII